MALEEIRETYETMITRPRTAPNVLRVSAYDFEWTRTSPHEITLCGAYDERGYRWYPNCRMFLRGELVPKNAGRCYYAHFGGASDMVFLLKELMRDRDLSIKGVFSGSSAIIISVTRGELEWKFLDSYWLMRTKLANIGKFMGLPKMAMPNFDEASMAELRDYNERDCELLYRAVMLFQSLILEAGGEMGATAASTALRTFLRAYLQRPIRNTKADDDYVRPAYTASMVLPVRHHCETAIAYDINSSFPYSMTFPCPGECKDFRRKLTDDSLWFADVTVVTPDDEYLPALPYRVEDKRVFFPTGRFRTRISSEDYLSGGFEIEKLHSVRHYEDRDDLREFAEDMYRRRKGAEPGGFESEVWKIVVNGSYGKWAEREDKQSLYIRPKHVEPHWEPLLPHVYLVPETIHIKHSHVPFAAMITARSRRLLLNHARFSAEHGELYYCDTDSVITTASLPTSAELGGMKIEKYIKRGRFIGSKLYALEIEAEEEDKRLMVKAKGFSNIVSEGGDRVPLTYDQFIELSEGRTVQVERMLRIKELLRREGESYVPRTIRQDKRLGRNTSHGRVMPRPKRKHLEDGDSRPWTIEELSNGSE